MWLLLLIACVLLVPLVATVRASQKKAIAATIKRLVSEHRERYKAEMAAFDAEFSAADTATAAAATDGARSAHADMAIVASELSALQAAVDL